MTTPPTPQPQPAPLPERVQEMLAATSGHTAGPWKYRHYDFDDWGMVRGPGGWLVALARDGEGSPCDSHEEHRRAGTDPYEANARAITHLPTLRALLAETAAALAAAEAREAGLRAALGAVLSACELQQTDYPECRTYMTLSMADFETARATLGGNS